MNTFSPSIDQIISQATKNNMNTQAIDIETLFGDFNGEFDVYLITQLLKLTSEADVIDSYIDYDNTNTNSMKPLMTTDDLLHSLIHTPSSSSNSPAAIHHLQQQAYTPSPIMNTPCLDAFQTPFTPSINGFHSPMMTTPYMDPLIGNHFTTPYMDASSTPFMGTSTDCMEQYFTPMIGNQDDHDFTSVNPSQLALDQQQQPSSTLALNNNDDDDSLFPPLTNEEQEQQDQQLKLNSSSDQFKNELDDLFDDLFGSNDKEQQQPTENNNNAVSHKRKLDQVDDVLTNNNNKMMKENNSSNKQQLYVCDVCQRGFTRRYNLGTHVKTHDKNRIKPFACSLCPKTFDRKHDCERHISTVHMGERLFTCAPCNVSFSRRDALHRHQAQKHSV